MKQLERESHFAQVATTTTKIVLCLASVVLVACTDAPEASESGRSAFLVPLEYDPAPGSRSPEGVLIEAAEFSLMLGEAELAAEIEGFQPRHYGVSEDTTIIVNVYDPATHDDWKPSEQVVEAWDSIWNMTGGFSQACMGNEKDELTGYYRYYQYCTGTADAEPTGFFFLVDRIPDPNEPRPPSQDYIKGGCRVKANSVRPDLGPYHQCQFFRTTTHGDRYSFRLRGENVRLLPEVEEYIRSKLEEWRIEPRRDP
jgi:hypothetical protein